MKLQMLDTIVSYKRPDGLFAKVADDLMIKYQEKMYPGGNNRFNHVRVYIGEYACEGCTGKLPLVFDWTSPVSRVTPVRPWMLDPEYAWVMRHSSIVLDEYGTYTASKIAQNLMWERDLPPWRVSNNKTVYPMPLLDYCLERSGKLYDYLQLPGMALNLKWMHLGKDHEVCSTGARILIEDITGIESLFPGLPVWKTPPSAFTNDRHWRRIVKE